MLSNRSSRLALACALSLSMPLGALVEEARKVAHFPMERTSWLRFVDPLLNDRLAHADQGNHA